MTKKLFDPEKAFFQLPIVWGTIFFFIIVSVTITIVILFNSKLQIDLSYSGFNFWITVYKLPLGILALLIPVIAVLATNHRSEQTKETINLTRSQNRFSNYYKHLEEFTKYTDKIKNEDQTLKIDPRKLHGHLFPYARNGSYLIDKAPLTEIKQTLERIISLLKSISLEDDEKVTEGTKEIINTGIHSLSKHAINHHKKEPDFKQNTATKEAATNMLRSYQISQRQSIQTIILNRLDELKKYDEILRFETEQYASNNINEIIAETIIITSKIPSITNFDDQKIYMNPARFKNNETGNIDDLHNKILLLDF